MYSSSRIQQVQAHNQLMTKLYQQEINNSIASSTIYSVDSRQPANFFSSTQTLQELWINSTTQAVSQLSSTYPQAKIACLNFADYEQTAGGYLQGAFS